MKDLSIYFSPLEFDSEFSNGQIGEGIKYHTEDEFPEIPPNAIVLFHVPEFRGYKSAFSSQGYVDFRTKFYSLFKGDNWERTLVDLGNVLPGDSIDDTYFAVSQIIGELVKLNCIPVLVGGSQDLTFAVYKGYEKLEQMVNTCSIDFKLDLGSPDSDMHADGYLSRLLLERPCYLFNHANIGMQAPYVSREEVDLFDKLFFDSCRLGEFNADFKKAEPHLRNSDILSVDFRAIKGSELNDANYSNPNGFTAEQFCQLAKYAGLSDKLTTFALLNYFGSSIMDAALMADVLWYFMDGVAGRKGDFPLGSKKSYFRFTVHLDDFKDEVVFYKSDRSSRWWMEVPYPSMEGSAYDRHHLVPCDQTDYDRAMKNELPDLWWKTYQKLTT